MCSVLCGSQQQDTSQVTDMSELFRGESAFNDDIGRWDVSSVTSMYRMFWAASSFNGDVSSWNVAKVSSMGAMFKDTRFNGNLSVWDVSSVSDMSQMFESAIFNSDISGAPLNNRISLLQPLLSMCNKQSLIMVAPVPPTDSLL